MKQSIKIVITFIASFAIAYACMAQIGTGDNYTTHSAILSVKDTSPLKIAESSTEPVLTLSSNGLSWSWSADVYIGYGYDLKLSGDTLTVPVDSQKKIRVIKFGDDYYSLHRDTTVSTSIYKQEPTLLWSNGVTLTPGTAELYIQGSGTGGSWKQEEKKKPAKKKPVK